MTTTNMLRLILLSIVAAMSVSGETIGLEHELLTGEVAIGQALIGQFYSAATIGKQIEQYLDSVKNVASFDQLFEEFKAKYSKSYGNHVEETRRRQIFAKNVAMVLENNVKAAHSESQYTMAISGISDLALDEILAGTIGNWPAVAHLWKAENTSESVYADSWVFDTYRQHHQVGPIQNQGGCGSCAYFAAAATIESSWARKGHKVEPLSTQQLNDCARDERRGNHGCQHGGGTFVPTFDYIQRHGLTSWANYPYIGRDANCDRNKENQPVAHIREWHPVLPHSQDGAVERALNDHGPIAVALHVSDGLAHYHNGIFSGDCRGARNHAVLIVGYGYDLHSNQNYWIVKNQWGEGWGDHGYFRLRKDHGDGFNNWCDISSDAVFVE